MKKQNYLLMPVVASGVLGLFYKFKVDKSKLEICEKQNYLNHKYEQTLITYKKWIEAFQNNKTIADYLLENKYHKIAVYGFGRLGKQLYEELLISRIQVEYVIDRNRGIENKLDDGIGYYHPDDELPNVDLIIVTIPDEAKGIIDHLREKTECPIKSIDDLLFVI